ncbi:MAG TPA: HD domain-containing phosphohydrolase, partial [Anaerolineae bacterium]|nr:HD domain-containing phosphohydrolase [Anaerolineae bacterium]
GYVENIFIKTLGHPYLSILRAPAINEKFNKTKTVEIVKSHWSHAVVRLKWFKNIGSTKDICLYNLGVYESIPTIWGLPMGKLTEYKCFFNGDEYCEFKLEWAKKSIFALIFGMFSRRKEIINDSLAELEREKILLERKYREVENLNAELNKKIERMTSLDACSKATASILDTDILLDVVMSLILNIMQFDRAIIMLVDEETRKLVPVKTASGNENAMEQLRDYSISLSRTNNILARVVSSGIAEIINDVDHSFLRKENIILKKFHPKSFIAVPLITRNKVIGVMAAERVKGFDNFSTHDIDYVMNFCNQIANSLDNARLIEHMKKSFESSILSLASALEAKDPYTRGHSNRVATYSSIIARRMGMDEEFVEMIRLMALMHDVGKIGIMDAIIHKPGSLTVEEFKIVKRHPLVSLSIIEPLLANKPELHHIKHHHERYDGEGYPDGLAGTEIPIEARIMAVADAFDAMTTDRPYRSALTREMALEEIKQNKGTQFCPEIAELFVKVICSFPEDLYLLINSCAQEALQVDGIISQDIHQ